MGPSIGLRHADVVMSAEVQIDSIPSNTPIGFEIRSVAYSFAKPPAIQHPKRAKLTSFARGFAHVFHMMAPTLFALSLVNVAHAQGTMDSSGAQTLMGTPTWSRFMALNEWDLLLASDHRPALVGKPLWRKRGGRSNLRFPASDIPGSGAGVNSTV